jgi:hypothetical protein
MSEIARYRGDTKPISFKIWADKTKSAPLDIRGFSFRLTVDPEAAPVDDSNNLFSLVGIPNVATGEIRFLPTAEQMDLEPGAYYFDFEVTDSEGLVGTEMLDKFKITQDISK